MTKICSYLASNILENKPECTFLISSGCQVATFLKTDFIMVFVLVYIFFEYVTLCTIWYHLYNFKNLKRTHRRVLLLVKLHKDICNFSKSNTHPWVFSTFSYIVKMVPNCAKRHIWTDFWSKRFWPSPWPSSIIKQSYNLRLNFSVLTRTPEKPSRKKACLFSKYYKVVTFNSTTAFFFLLKYK